MSAGTTASHARATARATPRPFVAGAFPRGPLLAVGIVLLASVLAVGIARLSGVGTQRTDYAPAIAVGAFHFQDRADGAIEVRDAHGRIVHTVAPGTDGFLRGTMRGLARERKRQGIGPEPAFHLVGRADGRLTLEDRTTGRRVDLESFGPTNASVFAALLEPTEYRVSKE